MGFLSGLSSIRAFVFISEEPSSVFWPYFCLYSVRFAVNVYFKEQFTKCLVMLFAAILYGVQYQGELETNSIFFPEILVLTDPEAAVTFHSYLQHYSATAQCQLFKFDSISALSNSIFDISGLELASQEYHHRFLRTEKNKLFA